MKPETKSKRSIKSLIFRAHLFFLIVLTSPTTAFGDYELELNLDAGIGNLDAYFFSLAWGDYDNDGLVDLFAGNCLGEANHLYRNNGNGTFSIVFPNIFSDRFCTASGAAWADYDNDGDIDLFVSNHSGKEYGLNDPTLISDQFYLNNGDGTLTEITEGVWVNDDGEAWGPPAMWADYDNDGYVDLYVGNVYDERNFLYHNNGDGTMTGVGGVTTNGQLETHGVVWMDYNNDRYPDLFVFGQDWRQFRNLGDGTFSVVEGGLPPPYQGFDNYSEHGVAAGDFDNDGDMDLIIATLEAPNYILTNNGDGTFSRLDDGVVNVDDGSHSLSASCADYDNDGFIDIYITNFDASNALYKNLGNGRFEEVTEGFLVNNENFAWSVAWADYDNDGDLDLVESDCDLYPTPPGPPKPLKLFQNSGGTNHWITFSLVGTQSNRSAIGAKVRIYTTIDDSEFSQMREVTAGVGLGSQSDPRVHFGLGDASTVARLRIEWPSGNVDEVTNLAANHFYTFTEEGTESIVTIPDANLELSVRETLGKPEGDITLSDMESLTELRAVGGDILDLSGLETATNLTSLTMAFWTYNPLTDISPISHLRKLTELRIVGTRISDISPLENLSYLTTLELVYNQIQDITPISNLTRLEFLDITHNYVTDISPISGLVNLDSLTLDYNPIENISPITDLTNPTSLSLVDTGISDINWLSNYTNLTSLHLSGNNLSAINPLENLTNLTRLTIDGNDISDISSLSSLRNLEYLNMDGNLIENINALSALTKLHTLLSSYNDIQDLCPLQELSQLELIYLNFNDISDLSPLRNLDSLVYATLAGNRISDLTPLSELKKIGNLELDRNEISDISALSGLDSLTSLDLGRNQISDLRPISHLNSLKRLFLNHNRIIDIHPISGLTTLNMLFLNNNYIRNIEALQNMLELRDGSRRFERSTHYRGGGATTFPGLYLSYNYLDTSLGSNSRAIIDELESIDGLTVVELGQTLPPTFRAWAVSFGADANDPLSDSDGNAIPDLLDYVYGNDDTTKRSLELAISETAPTLRVPVRFAGGDGVIVLEQTHDFIEPWNIIGEFDFADPSLSDWLLIEDSNGLWLSPRSFDLESNSFFRIRAEAPSP